MSDFKQTKKLIGITAVMCLFLGVFLKIVKDDTEGFHLFWIVSALLFALASFHHTEQRIEECRKESEKVLEK